MDLRRRGSGSATGATHRVEIAFELRLGRNWDDGHVLAEQLLYTGKPFQDLLVLLELRLADLRLLLNGESAQDLPLPQPRESGLLVGDVDPACCATLDGASAERQGLVCRLLGDQLPVVLVGHDRMDLVDCIAATLDGLVHGRRILGHHGTALGVNLGLQVVDLRVGIARVADQRVKTLFQPVGSSLLGSFQ